MNKEVVEQQDNVVTTKDKYNRVIKRSIILCWIALAICFIVKIFGGNFFEIVVHRGLFFDDEIAKWEAFKKLCTTDEQLAQVEKHIKELKAKKKDA